MQMYPIRWGEPIPVLVPVPTKMPWGEIIALVIPFHYEAPGIGALAEIGEAFLRSKRIKNLGP